MNSLTIEEKAKIKDELTLRASRTLKNFKPPVKPGLLGAITGRLGSFEKATQLVTDDLNAIIREHDLNLTKEAQDDLVSYLNPTIKALLKHFIQPR